MADKFSKEKRSWIMSRIKSSNTKVKTAFLKHLSSSLYPRGYRYRKYYSRLPGKPDVVFIKQKLAIFIDGDFKLTQSFAGMDGRFYAFGSIK